MVSDHIVKLCTDFHTVSSVLDEDNSKAPSDIIESLYSKFERDPTHSTSAHRKSASEIARNAALACGKWGPTAPSPLFLQAFADALGPLETDPLSGVVSPPLMGSHGTAPLTVISPLSDVIRHCSNLIARAEKEVFFVTCAWSPSFAQRLISTALVELSKRSVAAKRQVTVRFIYDSAGISNAVDAHQRVTAKTYTGKAIQLPSPEDLPNLDFEVMSLHKMPLGTLHAKFCVVDRKYAAVMSNNMQDNDNLEMMVHLEGPIVESIRDTAVITWHSNLDFKLDSPRSNEASSEKTVEESHALNRATTTAEDVALAGDQNPHLEEHTPEDPHFDSTIHEEILRVQSSYASKPGETRLQATSRLLNLPVKNPIKSTGPDIPDGMEMTPYLSTTTTEPVPMAMVSRQPFGCPTSKNEYVPQNEAWLSLIRNAKHSIFIQTPDLNAAPLLPELVAALKRGVEVTIYVCFGYNDLGEMIPGQGGTNDQVAISLINSLPENGPERKLLQIYNYVGKDQDHPIHQTFKSRSCHIKLLIVDGAVGIQGSGNQDTQSWFHSQEVNVMIDSRDICEKWREGIDRNQNTRLYGRVADDGIWRDKEGNPGKGYMGNPGKVKGLLKGSVGMFMKMEGLGGF